MFRRIALLLSVLAISGCSRFAPDAGYETVLIKKPWFFGHGGIDPNPVKTGLTFGAITTSGIDVYMQPQKFEADLKDTMTSDGVPISFHSIVVLQVTDSVKLIEGFGENWYANNLDDPFKTMVRQAVRKHGMNETAISTAAIDAIDKEIHEALGKFIDGKGLPLRLVTLTVGKANPPDSVRNQRIDTAAQQQRIQTEQQRKLAEDGRLEAEKSRAAADNAYRESMHLSPEQFVQLEMVKMQAEVCGAHGKANCTFIQNGAVPVYNLGK
jgi:hypothetical protein